MSPPWFTLRSVCLGLGQQQRATYSGMYLELFPALVDLRSKPGILLLTVRVQPLGLRCAESFSSASTIWIETNGLYARR